MRGGGARRDERMIGGLGVSQYEASADTFESEVFSCNAPKKNTNQKWLVSGHLQSWEGKSENSKTN